MISKLAALAAVATLTVSALAGCGGGGAKKSGLESVTLNVGDQKGASIKALLEAAGEGGGTKYKISYSTFTSGPPILEAINAGSVDFGSVGSTPPIFSAAASAKIVIIGATDSVLDGQAVLVPKDSPIKTPADLRGKKVAVAKGSSANYQLLAVLKKNGLGFTDIQPQFLQPADALAAFSTGKVDAWAIWEPYTAQVQATLGARILADGNGYVNGYSFQVTGRGTLADKNRTAALKDFLARYQRAIRWATAHQPEWSRLWSREIGLPTAVTDVATKRRTAKVIAIDDTVINAEQQEADAFTAAKLLPGQVRIAGVFDNRFNDLVQAG
jgi:sulfonate transport system substrate-binding protein